MRVSGQHGNGNFCTLCSKTRKNAFEIMPMTWNLEKWAELGAIRKIWIPARGRGASAHVWLQADAALSAQLRFSRDLRRYCLKLRWKTALNSGEQKKKSPFVQITNHTVELQLGVPFFRCWINASLCNYFACAPIVFFCRMRSQFSNLDFMHYRDSSRKHVQRGSDERKR